MNKGKLIVIEGSDGCGKATQAAILYEALKSQGKNVRLITFPNYQSPSSELVKMYLSGKFGEKADETNIFAISTFYAVDRFSSYELDWKKFYESGGIVISDRYATSNMIHQGSRAERMDIGLEGYLNWVRETEYEKFNIPRPDMVLFLDVPPAVSQALMENRANKFTNENKKDIHERDLNFMQQSYEAANRVVSLDNWIKVCCVDNNEMKSREEIAEDILKLVNRVA